MPTYDYQCGGCGHEFEEFQSFSEKALTTCPKCTKKKLQRLFGTGAAILFKGSGFYETDYRSEGYKAAAKADSDKASSSPKADSTPAKPAESPKPAESGSTAKKGKK